MATIKVVSTPSVTDDRFDGVILLVDGPVKLDAPFEALAEAVDNAAAIQQDFYDCVSVIVCPTLPSKRLVVSPTGPLNRDYDDARRFADAAGKGIMKAMDVGCRRPLLVLGPCHTLPSTESWAKQPYPLHATTLGALHALYTPLEVREFSKQRSDVTEHKADLLGIFEVKGIEVDYPKFVQHMWALEEGRRLGRDIGGSDPERMAAPRIVEQLYAEFPQGSSSVTVKDQLVDPKLYPLAAAVDRAAKDIPRHAGRIVHLEYSPSDGLVEQTLFLVGKGITYDTGGADIKAGGIMAGMHRDKCGAAAVAGFFKVLDILKPKKIKVVGILACIRNSVGPNSYVSDEIITSRANVRVRVWNTDAEGRMVMSDPLCEAKDMALHAVNPHIYTIATLTGHVVRCYGGYGAILSNGPANRLGIDSSLQASGDVLGDMFEISRIRREDWEFHEGHDEYTDTRNSTNVSSTNRPRGHMTPPAFMMMASGLDKHLLDSDKPLPYTHLDIAGGSGPYPGLPTATPILALASKYVLHRCA